MKRFWVFALGLSRPGTMGGNSKIALEVTRCFAETGVETHLVVPSDKVKTVEDAIADRSKIRLHVVAAFPGDDKFHPLAASRHFIAETRKVFRAEGVGPSDTVWGISEFHADVIPLWVLKREFGFRWVASVFLFVPFVFENLAKGYGFPPIKYFVYWVYERLLFRLARLRAEAFVITNDTDRRFFPKAFQKNVFAFYGGVNVEQIPEGSVPLCPEGSVPKVRDVVFCSRLHPQKGIDGFLDIWKLVIGDCPRTRLAVIGNGTPEYEAYLKEKATRLGIADTIEWLGYVNNEAKYEIYRSAKVMVHPTVFDNNGMVAAEALCSGLPVVMYDLPALRDVYTTGCVKVPFGDREQFAAEVVRLLADPSRVAPDVAQIAALRDKWNWENRVAAFRKFLDSML